MRTLIWSLTALMAAIWTSFVAFAYQLAAWLLSAIHIGSLQGAAGSVGALPLPPMPDWMTQWIDPATALDLQSLVVSVLRWLGAVTPSGEALMAWVGPLLWLGWALVLVLMLAIAAFLHLLIGRIADRQPDLRGTGA